MPIPANGFRYNIFFIHQKFRFKSIKCYQAYASETANTTFEKDWFCEYSRYVQIGNDKLLIFTGEYLKSPSGKFEVGVDMLIQSKPKLAPGKLTLVYPIGVGDYWVIGVSDIDPITGKYTWSGIKG